VSKAILDSSALLAMIQGEPGGDTVLEQMGHALISAVNLAEVGSRLWDKGMRSDEVQHVLRSLDVEIVSFDESQALASSALRPISRRYGLSLGDRACLALGQVRGLPVLTADRSWVKVGLDVEIRVIRE
jgi:PIN domain nuclease of toxin-antitoxin system